MITHWICDVLQSTLGILKPTSDWILNFWYCELIYAVSSYLCYMIAESCEWIVFFFNLLWVASTKKKQKSSMGGKYISQ